MDVKARFSRLTRGVAAKLCLTGIALVAWSGLLQSQTATRDVQSVRDLVGKSFEAKIVAVIDGDTVEGVRDGERLSIRIRLEGIDTPERGEPYSQEARRLTRSLLFDQPRDRLTVDFCGRQLGKATTCLHFAKGSRVVRRTTIGA